MSNHKTIALSAIAIAMTALSASNAFAVGTAYTLEGSYIKIGTNDWGTIGSFGNTSPGILYDNTGTGTFNTAYDYLTPGSPFEGFAIKATSGSTYTAKSNNASGLGTDLTTTSFTNTSSGSRKEVVWSGSYTPSGGSKLYDVENTVGFDAGDKQIKISTKITAAQNLTNLELARFTDPDARAAAGDSTSTNNIRGSASVSANQLVYAEALVSKHIIGLYSAATTGVNTAISPGWSQNPSDYVNYAGTSSKTGDDVIGLGFNIASLAAGDSIIFTYYYIFGSDIAAALSAAGAGKSVLTSAQTLKNNPSYSAATIIDNTPALLALFDNVSGDQATSAAASQTLPLLTGGSMAAAGNALSGINKVIQARIESNRGLSSGDGFFGDKYVWVKPFGSWADQDDQQGVSGFKSTTTGVAFGVDSAVNDKLRLGTAMAYAKADVDSNSNVAKQSADVDVFQLVGYGSYSLGNNSEVNFQVDVGQNSNKGRRSIAFTNSTATSEYTSYTAHAGAGLGRTYQLNAATSITPSIRADYTWIKDKAYQESGAGLLNLNVGSRDSEELVLGLDGKISHQLSDNTSLSANLGVGYDTMAKRSSITATFAGAPGAAFTTYGLDAEPWSARAGVGLTHTTANGTEITLRYDAEHREAFLNQTASLKARWAF